MRAASDVESGGIEQGELHALVGKRVFFNHPRHAWQLVQVLSAKFDPRLNAAVVSLRDGDGDRLEARFRHDSFYAATPGVEVSAPDDLLMLSELHLAVLLNSLRLRFSRDIVYTYLGELVVAINPFKYTIPWYQPSMIAEYLQHRASSRIPTSLRPHTWSVAHRTFTEMRRTGRNQSIIISGESGAGKTESCKIMLTYLCAISTAAGEKLQDVDGPQKRAAEISERVQQASPILEAFGNAKTVRNDNSSRFGKFMEVQFNEAGALCGMRITPYLLEKSRAVSSASDERVYHCFYQFLAGAPDSLRAECRISKDPRDFNVLVAGGAPCIRGIDDAQEFASVVHAMNVIGFTDEDRHFIWRTLASVMHLMNLEFGESTKEHRAFLTAPSESMANFVATDLLRLSDVGAFIAALTSQSQRVRNEVIVKYLSKQKAEDQRDSLCRHLYARMFNWIVNKINDSTTANYTTDPPRTFIGLLDIFGFEDMHANSFEQLCINLANEALQRHYTRHVFLKDVEEMRCEGVDTECVRFHDNQPCLDLLYGRTTSVIAFLDDASTLDLERSATNPNFTLLDRLTRQFKPDYGTVGSSKGGKSVLDRCENEMTQPADFFSRGKLDDDSFTVRHYAGDVKYHVQGFVEKNVDTLRETLVHIILQSSEQRLQEVMSCEEVLTPLTTSGVTPTPIASSTATPSSPMSPRRGLGGRTVASQFRTSLLGLIQLLESTQPNWVRCLRPHPRKLPNMFDGKSVLEQLVATGVLETIEQRRRNFPYRLTFEDFLNRYTVLAAATIRRAGLRLSPAEKCRTALMAAGGSSGDATVGTSKVFLKAEAYSRLETARNAKMDKLVIVISRFLWQRDANHVAQFHRFKRASVLCQRVRRLTVKLRRCCREYYQELWMRRERRHHEQRRDEELDENRGRSRVLQLEATERHDVRRAFLHGLAPLVAAVLMNIQVVEASTRLQVEEAEAQIFTSFAAVFDKEAHAALARVVERQQRRLAMMAEEQRMLVAAYNRQRSCVLDEEAEARSKLYEAILPAAQELRQRAARRAMLLHERDATIRLLEAERSRELQRLSSEAEAQRLREKQLWRNYAGEQTVREDMRRLSTMGLPATSVASHLSTFYQLGTPTKIVTGASSPVRRGTAQPTSYDGFAAGWRNSYDQQVTKRTSSLAVSPTSHHAGRPRWKHDEARCADKQAAPQQQFDVIVRKL